MKIYFYNHVKLTADYNHVKLIVIGNAVTHVQL